MSRRRLKLLDRYVGGNILQGFLLLLSILLVLFSFIELLSQLNDVGKGDFHLSDAFMYAALTLPKQAADLMPLSALLGSIVALGLMADHQELTAMQAAGISVQRISAAAVTTSVALMLTSILVSEWIAPPLYQHARIKRSEARYGSSVLVSKGGFWVRQGDYFIHVGRPNSTTDAENIEVFEIDDASGIRRFMFAAAGRWIKGRNWLLKDVDQKTIDGGVISHQRLPSYRLEGFLSPDQMQILKMPPDSLSLTDLYQYIQDLRERDQNVESYALAFWQKITLPITTSIMVLFSLGFVFGPTRSWTAGQRIAGAMLVGVMFHLINQILGHLGLLYELSPVVITLLPVGVILIFALRLLRRAL
ncbi:MAG: LPS export ABC transporter permease LptG [Desulfobacterales bacterium]